MLGLIFVHFGVTWEGRNTQPLQYELLTENIRWTSTCTTTKLTRIQSIHSGSSAFGSLTEKKMVTTARRFVNKPYIWMIYDRWTHFPEYGPGYRPANDPSWSMAASCHWVPVGTELQWVEWSTISPWSDRLSNGHATQPASAPPRWVRKRPP